jgi:hypothetical protein
MKFNNVVYYCKGWYQSRGSVKTMWIDLGHCIHADGWCPQTKEDVAFWCLDRLDELRKDKKFTQDFKIDLSHFLGDMLDNKRRAKDWYNEELDYYDLICLNFRNIISEMHKTMLTEHIKPSPDVLPVNLHPAWYSERENKLYPAQMMCDFMDKVNEFFPDAKDQDLKYYNFENVEAFLKITDYHDVYVINGSDNLYDCWEIKLTGKELNRKETDKINGCRWIDRNIYNSVTNFENDKTYIVRYTIDEFDTIILKSVKDYNK